MVVVAKTHTLTKVLNPEVLASFHLFYMADNS